MILKRVHGLGSVRVAKPVQVDEVIGTRTCRAVGAVDGMERPVGLLTAMNDGSENRLGLADFQTGYSFIV